MEVFYSNTNNDDADWQQLNLLLASPDVTNVALGLTLLGQSPSAIRQVAPALALVAKFHALPLQADAEVLLNTYLPIQQVALVMQPLRVFDPIAGLTTPWATYAQRVQIFEKAYLLYAPYFEQNSNYAKWYFQIAKIAINEYKQWAIGFIYLEKILALQPDFMEPRLYWIDAFVFYFFPKQQKLELIDEVLAQINSIEAKVKHIAPLAAFRRGLIYNSVRRLPILAAQELQKALDGGLQSPDKQNVMLDLARLYLELENYPKAAALLQAIEKNEGPHNIYYELGLTAWKGFNNPHAAINLFKRVATRQPHAAKIAQMLAELYAEIGDRRNAQFYQQQALKYED
jgi:tetratricopeptide (TPR) repeat protein